jgi:hypothetical protein
MPGGFSCEGERCNVDAADRSSAGAHLDCGHAGNDGGHAYGDEKFVGAGGDLLEYVLAAYVGVCARRSGEEAKEHDEKCADGKLHR